MEVLIFIIYFILILVIYSVLYGIATWKLFKYGGESSWKAYVPILNFLTTLKIIQRPWWWILIIFIPVVGPILQIVILIDFLRCYDKKKIGDIMLTIIFNIFYLGFVNYNNNTQFIGVENRKETIIASILFAVIFATIIHTYVIQPYVIPTSSMERTLLVGDFLFVSKLNYGARIPMTPIALPFLQSKIPWTGIKPHNQINSYIDVVRIPYMRIPGWEKIKRYDIVTFNYPSDSSHNSIDRKDPYVKRCLGLPGDSISFRNGRAFFGKKEEQLPKDAERQFKFKVIVNGELSNLKLKRLMGFVPYEVSNKNGFNEYVFPGLTEKIKKHIASWENVVEVKEEIDNLGDKLISCYNEKNTLCNCNDIENIKIDSTKTIFPEDKNWNTDQYGPLYIPKKGDNIKLNKNNITQYYNIITRYEGNRKIEIDGEKILIDGKPHQEYKIQQNYYFMIGDNRDGSLDSRFFGYVPEDHILGKPVFIWLSIQGIFDSGDFAIRWNRMFKIPNIGNPNKTSYFPHFLVVLVIYFSWNFYRNQKKKQKS